MTYLVLLCSLAANGLIIWYVRKLLGKLQDEVEVREAYKKMLGDYADSLQNMYKLEELYGEEIIKRAINETRFVIEATEEFKKTLQVGPAQESQEDDEADTEGDDEDPEVEPREAKEGVIRLREGEKVSQDPATYRRVVSEP